MLLWLEQERVVYYHLKLGKKMSDARLNSDIVLSEEQWKFIRGEASKAWKNEDLNSDRRNAISKVHGEPVIIQDYSKKVIGEFTSQLKIGEYLGVSRYIVGKYLDSGNLLDTKIGPVFLTNKTVLSERSVKVQVLDINRKLLDTCDSIRAAANKYAVSASSISQTYLDKDKLCKGKYYFIKSN